MATIIIGIKYINLRLYFFWIIKIPKKINIIGTNPINVGNGWKPQPCITPFASI